MRTPENPGGSQELGVPPRWRAARSWARSGVMTLCGRASGPPCLPPRSAPGRLDEVVGEIRLLSGLLGREVCVRWDAALAGRAQILGLTRAGRTSANGCCRLLAAADGDVALNLPRPDDIVLVPALTGCAPSSADPWSEAAAMAASTAATEFVARARLLGLAASVTGERHPPGSAARSAYRTIARADGVGPRPLARLTVVDLSSLWAGPTAARILSEVGANVIKVEDPVRPDGARRASAFYSWIHPATEAVEHVGFTSPVGRRRLGELLDSADVVIESSRPRALEQLGLAPEQRPGPPGQIWLSLTGHGRTPPSGEWTGFGDDAAAAGGMLCREADGSAVFCGDAIADPVAGCVGALAVLRCLAAGEGAIVDLSLSGVAAWLSATDDADEPPISTDEPSIAVEPVGEGWQVRCGQLTEPVLQQPSTLDWVSA